MTVNLIEITAETFSEVADEYANRIYLRGMPDRNGKLKCNKSTQLRKFYEEVCMWQEKIKNDEKKFNENLTFIKMINAKVAYAKGRGLVDAEFETMIREGLKQVSSIATFKNFKTFFEAFMGFYKSYAKKS